MNEMVNELPRDERSRVPASASEVWAPIMLSWFPFALLAFLVVIGVHLYHGYYRKARTVAFCTLVGVAWVVGAVWLTLNAGT